MHELLGGARVSRYNHALLGKVDLGVQFVDRHPVLEGAVKPIGLFDEHDPRIWVRLEPVDHFSEGWAAAPLGGLHVHVFLHDRKALASGVVLQQLDLRGNRIAFPLLFLRGDARIDHRLS